jgi:hypothetical protein
VSRLSLFPASLACAALTAVTATAQQAFRASADIVSVYATVTDRQNRLVTDLAREDFEVRDDGRPQDLTVFSNDLQPFSQPTRRIRPRRLSCARSRRPRVEFL